MRHEKTEGSSSVPLTQAQTVRSFSSNVFRSCCWSAG
jgi:hypothetical protein